MDNQKISDEALTLVGEKVSFVTKRLSELADNCEKALADGSGTGYTNTYLEQSNFVLGICGRLLDEINGVLGQGRHGSFDEHPDVKMLGMCR